jgi:hypothetical protein
MGASCFVFHLIPVLGKRIRLSFSTLQDALLRKENKAMFATGAQNVTIRLKC